MPHFSKSRKTFTFLFEKDNPTSTAHRLLLLKYPLFFRAAYKPETLPCDLGHWGIRCGPGWLPILDKAIASIEKMLQIMMDKSCTPDFYAEVEQRMCSTSLTPIETSVAMSKDLNPNVPTLLPYCREISVNNWGGLEIGVSTGYYCDEEISLAIQATIFAARMTAAETCERCGAKGKQWRGYWSRVYCAKCAGLESTATHQAVKPVQPQLPLAFS